MVLLVIRAAISIIMAIMVCFGMLKKKQPLFLTCVSWGVICSFLSNIWNVCNYIWTGKDSGLMLIDCLSQIGFYLFLFTAAYGALDSLADDKSKELSKYRWLGHVAAAIVTLLWLINVKGITSLYIVVTGLALTALTDLVVKEILIPDIKGGFVRTLRPYNLVVLLLIIVKLCELFVMGRDDISNIEMVISIFRLIEIFIAFWVYPTAKKGVDKWELV